MVCSLSCFFKLRPLKKHQLVPQPISQFLTMKMKFRVIALNLFGAMQYVHATIPLGATDGPNLWWNATKLTRTRWKESKQQHFRESLVCEEQIARLLQPYPHLHRTVLSESKSESFSWATGCWSGAMSGMSTRPSPLNDIPGSEQIQ